MQIRKILAPVDFSEPSSDAVKYARNLARSFDAELTLLHVLPALQAEFSMAQPVFEGFHELMGRRREHVERKLIEVSEALEEGGDVERLVLEGDAATRIMERAHHGGYDLIVMSSRGMGPLRRWLLVGSVTSKVLFGAECPVISSSCFGDPLCTLPPRHVVCAIDLGPQSERALRYAAAAAKHFGAGLSIVHAASMSSQGAGHMVEESWRSTLHDRIVESIGELAKKLRIEADVVVDLGDPPNVVAGIARRLEAGLVVQGRGASTDLIGRLRASGYDIIRESPCPVATV